MLQNLQKLAVPPQNTLQENRAHQLDKNISMLFLFPVKMVSLVQASIHNVSYISLQ